MTTRTVLTLRERPSVPLEAEVLTPDRVAGLGGDELRALPVVLGKRQRRLDDFFDVEGPGGEELEIRGDVGRVNGLAAA
jgi:formylmethanofuran dehydrogenase subunit C